MFIVKYRFVFFLISTFLVLGSVFSLYKFGLNLGTDFTGGSILEVEYQGVRPSIDQIKETVFKVEESVGPISVQPTGQLGVIFRLKTINESEKSLILSSLTTNGASPVEKRFSSVGPTLGSELAKKGLISIVIVVIFILLYIAFVFRKVSRPVSSWFYGLVVILTMVHDVIIPTGVFAILGFYAGVPVDALFLTAFLTILGLSVNDKIVALDRIRENLQRKTQESFAEVVGRSLTETLTRSVNTSVTIIAVLLSVFFFGADSTKYFALAMAIGMIVATYSSIFIAAPLLVVIENRQKTKK